MTVRTEQLRDGTVRMWSTRSPGRSVEFTATEWAVFVAAVLELGKPYPSPDPAPAEPPAG